ncbi:MAG: PEP-CTERM sorting domain-containing protein [Candidatus Acidiferrales bacterium]
MRYSLVMIFLGLGCLPAQAFASDISCTVTGTNAVTIMESSNEADESGAATCKISGVTLPSSDVNIDILENQSDLNFDSSKPVSDYMEITPGGNIVLLSDSDTMGLPTRPTATVEGPEPVGFGPVVFNVDNTTYTVFSDLAPTPEPSTILLFGSGLLAFLALFAVSGNGSRLEAKTKLQNLS